MLKQSVLLTLLLPSSLLHCTCTELCEYKEAFLARPSIAELCVLPSDKQAGGLS